MSDKHNAQMKSLRAATGELATCHFPGCGRTFLRVRSTISPTAKAYCSNTCACNDRNREKAERMKNEATMRRKVQRARKAGLIPQRGSL